MSTANLEERVAALEEQYTELRQMLQDQPPSNAWRSVVGMFADDPQIEALHRETERIREEDREWPHRSRIASLEDRAGLRLQ